MFCTSKALCVHISHVSTSYIGDLVTDESFQIIPMLILTNHLPFTFYEDKSIIPWFLLCFVSFDALEGQLVINAITCHLHCHCVLFWFCVVFSE